MFEFEYLVLSAFGKRLVLTLNAAEKIVLGEDFEINLDISVFVCTIAENSWFEFSSSLVEVAMRHRADCPGNMRLQAAPNPDGRRPDCLCFFVFFSLHTFCLGLICCVLYLHYKDW